MLSGSSSSHHGHQNQGITGSNSIGSGTTYGKNKPYY